MRHAARITLFLQDRDGRLDTYPDPEVLHALMHQVPMVNRNPDGSRTLVFDLPNPGATLDGAGRVPPPHLDRLRHQLTTLAEEARALGLTRTAAVAEAAELLIEAELDEKLPPRGQ